MILWFSCYNQIMTSDKFIYLFGRIIPAMSLMLSMALRFVPHFMAQLKVIRNGQKCVGMDVSNGKWFKKIRYALNMVSILVTWALENAIETADSMKSRGYGLRGRTAFSIYRFNRRDKLLGTMLVGLCVIFGYGCYRGAAFCTVQSQNPACRFYCFRKGSEAVVQSAAGCCHICQLWCVLFSAADSGSV